MSIAIKLDDLRLSLPGCTLVVFGDLISKITLCVSAAGKRPQEQLDALCVTASNLLDGSGAQSAARMLGGTSNGPVAPLKQAVVLTPTDMHVFLRSDTDAEDVLCCVCSRTADVTQVSAHARIVLDQIAATQ